MSFTNIKVYSPDELSNEDYHGEATGEFVSGSTLCKIDNECPAAWRFADEERTAALEFGVASHASLLEPEKFEAEFVRGLEPSEYPNALNTDASMKAWLKATGVKGYSTKKKDGLIEMIINTGELVQLFPVMLSAFEKEHDDKTIVDPSDFDNIMQMRRVIFANPEHGKMLEGAMVEHSFTCEIEIDGDTHKVKIRPDIITKNMEVPDYKTTRSAKPEDFGRQAYYAGYWLKQALIHDVLASYFGGVEMKMGLMAQEKKAPFISQLFWLTEEQLEVGRDQYRAALVYYSACKEADVWPAYESGAVDLPTPGYIAKQYNF